MNFTIHIYNFNKILILISNIDHDKKKVSRAKKKKTSLKV